MDVARVPHDDWIVTTHFEGKDLIRPVRELTIKRNAGLRRSGEQQAVDIRMGRQGPTRFRAALRDADHALRNAGFVIIIGKHRTNGRGLFGRFENNRITRDQGRDDMAVR